jgi:hypothetical protein
MLLFLGCKQQRPLDCSSPHASLTTPVPCLVLQLELEGMEGDVGADGNGGGDDEDDFEAQMRALEEGL